MRFAIPILVALSACGGAIPAAQASAGSAEHASPIQAGAYLLDGFPGCSEQGGLSVGIAPATDGGRIGYWGCVGCKLAVGNSPDGVQGGCRVNVWQGETTIAGNSILLHSYHEGSQAVATDAGFDMDAGGIISSSSDGGFVLDGWGWRAAPVALTMER